MAMLYKIPKISKLLKIWWAKLFLWLPVMNNKFTTVLLTSALCLAYGKLYASDVVMNTARMQAMDKITGKVSEINVPVNGLANFGTFSILVRKCVSKSPEETPENTAFVDVVDNYTSSEPINIFKGWMFSSTPALNAVEHPIYDIWLLECYNQKHDSSRILTTEQLAIRDDIPMIRSQKIEQNIRLTITDKNEETSSVTENNIPSQNNSNETNSNETDVIKLNVDSTSEIDEKISDSEDFVSEGEEQIPETDKLEVANTDANNNEDENNYETIIITE
ncbi:MAG: DUF2155 domain-containing protein [Alphaproteobacteria bacterium]|nr:DUF2155 domain-containing protein [Alphaproteobacteria bacterium]